MSQFVKFVFSVLFGIVFYLALSILLYGCPQAKAQETCYKAQQFRLHSNKGKLHSLKQYRGKVVVVSFWATWCKPCLAELKFLNKLVKQQKDLVVLAVSIDGPNTSARVNQTSRRFKDVTVLLDPSGQTNPTRTVPYSIIVDKQGNQCYDKKGFIRGDEQELKQNVINLINKEV